MCVVLVRARTPCTVPGALSPRIACGLCGGTLWTRLWSVSMVGIRCSILYSLQITFIFPIPNSQNSIRYICYILYTTHHCCGTCVAAMGPIALLRSLWTFPHFSAGKHYHQCVMTMHMSVMCAAMPPCPMQHARRERDFSPRPRPRPRPRRQSASPPVRQAAMPGTPRLAG